VLTLAVPSYADLIFSTLGTGDTYSSTAGYTVGHHLSELDQAGQFSFAEPNPYLLDTIELAVGLVAGTNELDVWLMSDDGGEPGAIIEAFNFTNMGPWPASPLLVGNSVARPVLSPVTNYWLTVSAPYSDTHAAWNFSLPTVLGTRAERLGAGTWTVFTSNTMAAFRVNGTVVPVPGAVLLGILGLSVAGVKLRKRA
jgi:hypothetical protein